MFVTNKAMITDVYDFMTCHVTGAPTRSYSLHTLMHTLFTIVRSVAASTPAATRYTTSLIFSASNRHQIARRLKVSPEKIRIYCPYGTIRRSLSSRQSYMVNKRLVKTNLNSRQLSTASDNNNNLRATEKPTKKR
jgi:hypothetical protein